MTYDSVGALPPRDLLTLGDQPFGLVNHTDKVFDRHVLNEARVLSKKTLALMESW